MMHFLKHVYNVLQLTLLIGVKYQYTPCMTNLFAVPFYSDRLFTQLITNLRAAFDFVTDIEQIEIEVKYAQFTYFCGSFDETAFKELPPASLRKVYNLYKYQQETFFRTLRLLSRQNIIHLNPLRNLYHIESSFNEPQHKRFYHMREFLIKLCNYNERNSYSTPSQPPKGPPFHIYHDFSLPCDSHLLRLVHESEIRVDIHMDQSKTHPMQPGRYSYSTVNGWRYIRKSQLCPQVELMTNELPFRLAVNREIQSKMDNKTIHKLAEHLNTAFHMPCIRIKRILRVAKGDAFEFSFSQILKVTEENRSAICPILASKILNHSEYFKLDVMRLFMRFYSLEQRNNIHFEIESELCRNMALKVKLLILNDSLAQVQRIFENMVEQLYALFHCDHATKEKEADWLSIPLNKPRPGRLDNEWGGYMRHILYQRMEDSLPASPYTGLIYL